MAFDIVKENGQKTLTVNFYDEDDVLTTPASAYWKIDCLTTGTAILASTQISSPVPPKELTVTGTYNRIITQSNHCELRCVTVTTPTSVQQFYYLVQNLRNVTN